MILILSQDSWDVSTEEVQDWIEALGGSSIRLNGEDLNSGTGLTLRSSETTDDLRLSFGSETVHLRDVRAVWMRRWHTFRNLTFVDQAGQPQLSQRLRQHLVAEIRALSRGIEVLLGHANWLCQLQLKSVNKLECLGLAKKAGLAIPATLVTTDKDELRRFKSSHGRIVTKAIAEGRTFVHSDTGYSLYTEEVTDSDIERAPSRFFPSLFQELVQKEIEVRTFYLDGRCYSMAIFSQSDPKTRIDFRHYNQDRPNRFVPYRLPEEVAEAVHRFMTAVGLNTGSLDLIRTREGRHQFLEVNPAGQFRMVSEPCNYRLEKKVAEHLLELEAHG